MQLLVEQTRAGGHPLHVARDDAPAVAGGVLVLDFSGVDDGDGLEAAMRVPAHPALLVRRLEVGGPRMVQENEGREFRVLLVMEHGVHREAVSDPVPFAAAMDSNDVFHGSNVALNKAIKKVKISTRSIDRIDMTALRITLEQWSALVAVVEAGGYARAAEKLHKSQSSVTYAVQQLESLLGVDAFRIQGRKAVLTPTGELLYRRARYLLDEAAALEQSSKRLSAGWEAQLGLAVEMIFPSWLLLQCLDKLGVESPHTRIEVIESVLGHRTDALSAGQADLAIFGSIPPGFLGDALMQVRFVLMAAPAHPLHRLGRKLSMRDLRQHRHLVLRESSPDRTSPTTMDVTQRWTVSHIATLIEAARSGYGFAWLPEDKVRDELAAGTLKPLAMGEGGERFAQLYLIFADREHAGPATLRLAEIIREGVASECKRSASAPGSSGRRSHRPREVPTNHPR